MRVNIDVISVNLIRITLPLVTKNEQNNHDVDKKKKEKEKKQLFICKLLELIFLMICSKEIML